MTTSVIPFHNQTFERLHDGKHFEVHVVRFRLFEGEEEKLSTRLCVHELHSIMKLGIASYYLFNMFLHAREIRNIIRNEGIDLLVLSNVATPFAYTLQNMFERHVVTIVDLPDYYPTSATGYMLNVNSPPGKFAVAALDST